MVAPSLDILGGQGMQARSLAAALEAEGYDVLFIPVNPRFPRGLGWLRRIPVLRTMLNQCLYFATLGRVRSADIVHVYSASYWSFLLAPVPAILASRLFSKPVILNYHSGEAEDHLDNWGARVHPFLRMADEIVVPSAYLQSVFARHGYPARVVRNLIETNRFRYRERRRLRPKLLSNRNLEAHYRVIDILRAFKILQERWPEAELTVAGYGSESTRLKQWVRARNLKRVSFIGRVEPQAMPGVYDQADIFVNASAVDNQPVSILEAFAAGLPVVSTAVGDIPHMVKSGLSGSLVPERDPASIAAAITSLLDDPERSLTMSRRARNEVENYTWNKVYADWADIYASRHQSATPA
jgi:glycosyltransferase involved in cell wall biosynthesis